MKRIDLVLEKTEIGPATAYAVKLQGALMRLIDTGLAEELHSENLRPYSLFAVRQDDCYVLRLSALSEKGYPLITACETVKEFHLSGARRTVHVLRRTEYEEITLEDMCVPAPAAFSLVFTTPAVYKQKDRYQNWFSLPPLLTSVADKMRAFEGVDVPNEVLNEMDKSLIITDYELRTEIYPVKGGNYIKGFQGRMKCELTEPRPDIRAALILLLRYACFCGIGAKTALGMGGILLDESG